MFSVRLAEPTSSRFVVRSVQAHQFHPRLGNPGRSEVSRGAAASSSSVSVECVTGASWVNESVVDVDLMGLQEVMQVLDVFWPDAICQVQTDTTKTPNLFYPHQVTDLIIQETFFIDFKSA